MNEVGYSLSGHDNGTVMFPKEANIPTCLGCGWRLDFSSTNPQYVLKKSRLDISSTYDGQTIVSKAFKKFCEAWRYPDINFGVFENDPEHFHFMPTRQIKYDVERGKVRFLKLCSVCGNYESVLMTGINFLCVTEPLEDGFCRSDLLFASGNEKHPIILVGNLTKEKLENSEFRGLSFKTAYGLGGDRAAIVAQEKLKSDEATRLENLLGPDPDAVYE
jgi:hypothetical protein